MILTKNIYKASYFRAFDRCFTSGWLTSGSRFLFFLSRQKAVFLGLCVLLAHNLAIFTPISVWNRFLFFKNFFQNLYIKNGEPKRILKLLNIDKIGVNCWLTLFKLMSQRVYKITYFRGLGRLTIFWGLWATRAKKENHETDERNAAKSLRDISW